MFRLEEKENIVYCYTNGILKYIFERSKIHNGNWQAFNVKDEKSVGSPIDSDKYRYDLAERLCN